MKNRDKKKYIYIFLRTLDLFRFNFNFLSKQFLASDAKRALFLKKKTIDVKRILEQSRFHQQIFLIRHTLIYIIDREKDYQSSWIIFSFRMLLIVELGIRYK